MKIIETLKTPRSVFLFSLMLLIVSILSTIEYTVTKPRKVSLNPKEVNATHSQVLGVVTNEDLPKNIIPLSTVPNSFLNTKYKIGFNLPKGWEEVKNIDKSKETEFLFSKNGEINKYSNTYLKVIIYPKKSINWNRSVYYDSLKKRKDITDYKSEAEITLNNLKVLKSEYNLNSGISQYIKTKEVNYFIYGGKDFEYNFVFTVLDEKESTEIRSTIESVKQI